MDRLKAVYQQAYPYIARHLHSSMDRLKDFVKLPNAEIVSQHLHSSMDRLKEYQM